MLRSKLDSFRFICLGTGTPWFVGRGTQGGPGAWLALASGSPSAGRLWENTVCRNTSVTTMCHLAFEMAKFKRFSCVWQDFVTVFNVCDPAVVELAFASPRTQNSNIYFTSVDRWCRFSHTELIKATKVLKVEQPLLQWGRRSKRKRESSEIQTVKGITSL